MKKILVLGLLAISLGSCETEDTCHCEVFENIGTESNPSFRYIGSLDGKCSDQIQEEGLIYDTVSCE